MNQTRRKTIQTIIKQLDELEELQTSIEENIQSVKDEEEEYLNNIPENTPVNNVAEEFIVSYYNFVSEFIIRENNIDKCSICDDTDSYSIRTKGFLDWFYEEGKIFFCDVLENLDGDKLNENAKSFSKLYNYLLGKSISNSNLDALIDYLYLIPGVMKREYERFHANIRTL